MRLRDTLNYEPVALAFGTSGLRGRVRDMTHLEVVINTRGFLNHLIETGQVRPGDAVAVGGDLRPSTTATIAEEGGRGAFVQAVLWAVERCGLRPVYLGLIPTPAVLHYALSRQIASVMVTGSHIPFDRNGIKFNRPDGEVLKADEGPILEQVRRVRAEAYDRAAAASDFEVSGQLRDARALELPAVLGEGLSEYRDRYLRAFPPSLLQGRRLAVYEHSAVGRDLVVAVLRALGAEVVPVGRSETFIPVDTEAVDAAMLGQIQGLVDAAGGRFDAVVSTDGDSDRPLLLGFEGGQVQFFGGDLLGMVTADWLGAGHVAVPISANDAVSSFFEARGIPVERTRIGSPHVIASMREVGWEANGGFLTARALTVPGGGRLTALPTRDALLPLLACLGASLGRGRSVGAVFGDLPRRFGRSDLLRAFPRELSLRILERFAAPRADLVEARVTGAQWTVVTGASGSEAAPAGAGEAEALDRVRSELERWFPASAGFGRLAWLNYIDGVRAGFDAGDVVHLRPSGNAPEFRVYANADTAERAEAIVRMATAPDGVLRRMERSVPWRTEVSASGWLPRWLPMKGVVQGYDWGGATFIPELVGVANPERRPQAELWFGAHPGGPAVVDCGGRECPLPVLLDAAPEWVLGPAVAARHRGRFPYLFKVLDARQMLSIQVHPTREQAQRGFARENAAGVDLKAPTRNYRDDNHKPEVHVALTDFWMLHGFRPVTELLPRWAATPELTRVIPDLAFRVARLSGPASESSLVRALYERFMLLPQDAADACLRSVVARLEASEPTDRADPEFWVLRAARELPLPGGHFDRGLFSIYLLNLVHLRPGEGTYQPAGLPHAYLEGANVELMANSDNVLRGGLTRKHVDAGELLRTVEFAPGRPAVLEGEPVSPVERVFRTPALEFELSRIEVAPGRLFRSGVAHSADCLLVLEGTAAVRVGGERRVVPRGGAGLATAGLDYSVEGEGGTAVVFRARVPG